MTRYYRGSLVHLTLAAFAGLAIACSPGSARGGQQQGACWTEAASNPVITFGQTIPNAFWNDPTVISEAGRYRMYLSAGDLFSQPIRVDVYEATSQDGLSWTIDPQPRLSPGPPGSWDSLRIETPSVIVADGTYHMYYSGCVPDCETGQYQIGHATSSDGVTWTKDPANPVIKPHSGELSEWGGYTAVEPGAVYDEKTKTILVYYTGLRIDPATGANEYAILLATSSDGSSFEHHVDGQGRRLPVATLPGSYPASYAGVTMPMAAIDGAGLYHLFYNAVSDGTETFTTESIIHGVSTDGRSFRVHEDHILPAGQGDWKDAFVGATATLLEGSTWKMWFMGHTKFVEGFTAGIGFASASATCPSDPHVQALGPGASVGLLAAGGWLLAMGQRGAR